jgi:hypothetical protein
MPTIFNLLNELPIRNGNAEFYGRTFSQYIDMFDLNVLDLKNSKILDVPSGPASFVSEATRKGMNVIGIDPMYIHNDVMELKKIAKESSQAVDRFACIRIWLYNIYNINFLNNNNNNNNNKL